MVLVTVVVEEKADSGSCGRVTVVGCEGRVSDVLFVVDVCEGISQCLEQRDSCGSLDSQRGGQRYRGLVGVSGSVWRLR